MDLPPDVTCCHCGALAALEKRQDQGVMMTEDGREVDNPLSMGEYRCPQGHLTQAIYYHEEAELRVQEDPEFIIF